MSQIGQSVEDILATLTCEGYGGVLVSSAAKAGGLFTRWLTLLIARIPESEQQKPGSHMGLKPGLSLQNPSEPWSPLSILSVLPVHSLPH